MGFDGAAQAQRRQASASSLGKKVMIMTCGSRGDVQPFLALAAGLEQAGFRTMVLTNANHVAFAKSFGVEATDVFPDTEQLVKSTEGLLECMKKGNMIKFMSVIGEMFGEYFPAWMRLTLSAAERFQPDVVLSGALSFTLACAIGLERRIPAIRCDLMGFLPTGFAPSLLNEPGWAPAWVHRALNRLCDFAELKGDRHGKHGFLAEACPGAMPFMVKNMEQLDIAQEFRPEPVLMASSPLIAKPAKDWASKAVMTGHWVVGAREQEQRACRGDAHFAGAGALQAFLDAGPPPVYIGWGSMICVSSEFMACLAVRALRLASLRAVILGGWAALRTEHLRGHPDLLAYAEKHVLFVGTAAHECLLPRCAASVHHGGAGTTAAALRSGRPTIVTPCGFDQPLHARNVAAAGVGLALPPLARLTPDALAAALRRATTDAALVARAAEVGARLRAEDGVGEAVRFLDDFLANEVETGEWAKKSARVHAKVREYESPGFATRFAFLCAKLCTNSVSSLVNV